MAKISCPLIVKNEAPRIKRCLDSLRGFADEIIVMDTGSTDGTQDILDSFGGIRWFRSRRFTADTPAEEFDFAEARNEVLDDCRGEWILSVDADEVVEEDGLTDYLGGVATDWASVHLRGVDGKSVSLVPRCFRRKPEIRWYGKYHDVPTPWMTDQQAVIPPAVVSLFNDRLGDKSRSLRNLTLLKDQFAKERRVTSVSLRLADEYHVLGVRYAGEALGYYQMFLAANMGDCGDFTPYVLFAIGDCYMKIGILKPAIESFMAILFRWPKYAYAHVGLGECYLKMEEYDLALAHYQRASMVEDAMPLAPSLLTPIDPLMLERRIVYCAAKLDGFKGRLHESEGNDPCCERPEVAQALC